MAAADSPSRTEEAAPYCKFPVPHHRAMPMKWEMRRGRATVAAVFLFSTDADAAATRHPADTSPDPVQPLRTAPAAAADAFPLGADAVVVAVVVFVTGIEVDRRLP